MDKFGNTIITEDPSTRTLLSQAVQYLSKAIELDPNYPGFYILMGTIDLYCFDRDGAVENASRAIELDPLFSDEYCPAGLAQYVRGLGHCFMRFNKQSWEKALVDFEAAVDLGFEDAKDELEKAKEIIAKFEGDPQ